MRSGSSTDARRRRGFTLLEVTVALAVVATGVVALERLVARSTRTIAADVEATRALLAAQAVLAEAAVAPPEPGTAALTVHGLRVQREVRPTPHAALREIRVVVPYAGGVGIELLEVVRVPPA